MLHTLTIYLSMNFVRSTWAIFLTSLNKISEQWTVNTSISFWDWKIEPRGLGPPDTSILRKGNSYLDLMTPFPIVDAILESLRHCRTVIHHPQCWIWSVTKHFIFNWRNDLRNSDRTRYFQLPEAQERGGQALQRFNIQTSYCSSSAFKLLEWKYGE